MTEPATPTTIVASPVAPQRVATVRALPRADTQATTSRTASTALTTHRSHPEPPNASTERRRPAYTVVGTSQGVPVCASWSVKVGHHGAKSATPTSSASSTRRAEWTTGVVPRTAAIRRPRPTTPTRKNDQYCV